MPELPDLLDFCCPRCNDAVRERYYGPCQPCRAAMRSALGGQQREIEATPYEPKMNVTPNAVATKE